LYLQIAGSYAEAEHGDVASETKQAQHLGRAALVAEAMSAHRECAMLCEQLLELRVVVGNTDVRSVWLGR
jgi:hypothetical protein